MVQTSIQLDEGTAQAIEELKSVFGVKTSTGVIRKAVALARIASRNGDPVDHTVTLVNPAGENVKVLLVG